MTYSQRPQQTPPRGKQRSTRNTGQKSSRQRGPQATPTLYPHPEPRNEQERRQVEAADRRDRALLWTDDRPFSIYKS